MLDVLEVLKGRPRVGRLHYIQDGSLAYINIGSHIDALMATPLPRSAPLFAALADPTRLAILEQLRRGEQCVSDLCAAVAVSQSLMSFHLKVLRDVGLVFARKAGRTVWYALDSTGLSRLERVAQLLRGAGHDPGQASKAADLQMCMEYINGS